MSAKTQFLNKFQTLQSSSRSFQNKSQADIAGFRQRMGQLQERMAEWLTDTAVKTESISIPLTDLLVSNRAFAVPGILLRYESRVIKFAPLFLYGQGITGCVEVSLCAEDGTTPLHRLFMRSGRTTDWTCAPMGELSRPERDFDEEVFFGIIADLLP